MIEKQRIFTNACKFLQKSKVAKGTSWHLLCSFLNHANHNLNVLANLLDKLIGVLDVLACALDMILTLDDRSLFWSLILDVLNSRLQTDNLIRHELWP